MRFIDVPGQEKNKIELTPNAAKRIFELYIENEGLENKIEIWDIWKDGVTNPMQYIYEWLTKVGKTGDNLTVALGVSTKDAGDEKRFQKMKQDFAKYPNLNLVDIAKEPLDSDVLGTISATDMRDAITKALTGGQSDISMLQRYIPRGVSAESILKIVEEQPTWLVEASSMSAGSIEGSAGKDFRRDSN
jgi:hypothetical protein